MIEYVALAILGFIIVGQLIIIRTERAENSKMQLELMNRIQAPDTAVWKSLTSQPDPAFDKAFGAVPLEPGLSSEAEEGEMHLVGKVVQGDFSSKDKKNES